MKFDANPLIKSAIANPIGNTGKAKEKLKPWFAQVTWQMVSCDIITLGQQ